MTAEEAVESSCLAFQMVPYLVPYFWLFREYSENKVPFGTQPTSNTERGSSFTIQMKAQVIVTLTACYTLSVQSIRDTCSFLFVFFASSMTWCVVQMCRMLLWNSTGWDSESRWKESDGEKKREREVQHVPNRRWSHAPPLSRTLSHKFAHHIYQM